jgi:hypothetical protein
VLSVNTMKNLQLCPYRRVEGRDAYSFLPPISSSPQLGPGRAHVRISDDREREDRAIVNG